MVLQKRYSFCTRLYKQANIILYSGAQMSFVSVPFLLFFSFTTLVPSTMAQWKWPYWRIAPVYLYKAAHCHSVVWHTFPVLSVHFIRSFVPLSLITSSSPALSFVTHASTHTYTYQTSALFASNIHLILLTLLLVGPRRAVKPFYNVSQITIHVKYTQAIKTESFLLSKMITRWSKQQYFAHHLICIRITFISFIYILHLLALLHPPLHL